MRRFSILASAVLGVGVLVTISPLSGCGSTNKSAFGSGGGGSGGAAGSPGAGGGGSGGVNLNGGSAGSGGSAGAGGSAHACLSAGITWRRPVLGRDEDDGHRHRLRPGSRDPLYNVSVYVPAMPLSRSRKGVPTGADACSCGALLQERRHRQHRHRRSTGPSRCPTSPSASNVPLVIQIGKWRRQFNIDVTACQANAQPDKSLALPSTRRRRRHERQHARHRGLHGWRRTRSSA